MKIYAQVTSRIIACLLLIIVAAGIFVAPTVSRVESATPEKSVPAPRDVKVTVKMIGPVTQTTDLQIICLLKHNPAGDQYIEAMRIGNSKALLAPPPQQRIPPALLAGGRRLRPPRPAPPARRGSPPERLAARRSAA